MTQVGETFQDRLVMVKNNIRRGKRVGADCPLTRDEIRAYVEHGSVAAVKTIRANRLCSLRTALDLLNCARYTHAQFKQYLTQMGGGA
jgi:hypothetical protein